MRALFTHPKRGLEMSRAIWEETVLAESDRCLVVEGNLYFPPDALHEAFLETSQTHTVCSWKGIARYYDVVVNGRRNADAAWFYPDPKPGAAEIKGYVAFWRGVQVLP
jgi:uncharacterized protein (DUF427 family)